MQFLNFTVQKYFKEQPYQQSGIAARLTSKIISVEYLQETHGKTHIQCLNFYPNYLSNVLVELCMFLKNTARTPIKINFSDIEF